MASFLDRAKARVQEVRRDRPSVDHVLRMQEQYGATNASQQAGAVTYFGFLSFFPIMALAFFVVGYVAKVYPDAQTNLRDAVDALLPGIIGPRDNQISLDDVQSAAGTVGVIGLLGVLYSGLGWLSALREGLITVFQVTQREQPSFVMGKLRDLLTLVLLGAVLLFAVAVTGLVSGFSDQVLEWLGLDTAFGWLVTVLTIVIGLAANAVLFYAMFRLLAAPDVPTRSLVSGAVLGAVGFEVLKQVSSLLIRSTQGQPAFQVFGLALVLLVWINYFSRLTLYAAAWAWTDPLARAQRVHEPADPVQGPPLPSLDELPTDDGGATDGARSRKGAFVAGATLGAAAAAAAVRKKS